MLCPVCQEPLVIVEFEGVELDLCIDGHGTWFDDQELRILFESIDAPEWLHDLEQRLVPKSDPSAGKRRRCPRCGARMGHVTDPAHPGSVILDQCPNGHGLWFDAGELEQLVSGEDNDGALQRIRQHLSAFESSPTDRTEGTEN